MIRIDKIKNMDSLELGVFLEDSIGGAPWCKPSDVDVDPITKECKKWDCYECAREWLEEEVEESRSIPSYNEACSNWSDDPNDKDKPQDELRYFVDHFWDEVDD